MTLECVSSGIWAKACAKTSNRCDTMMRMAFFMMLVLCFLVIVCRFDGELATRYELFQYYIRQFMKNFPFCNRWKSEGALNNNIMAHKYLTV